MMNTFVFRQKWLVSTILNYVSDGIAAVDLKLSVIFMNPAAEKMSGLTEKEARKSRIQQTLSLIDPVQLSPLLPNALPVDERPRFFKNAILKSHHGGTIIVDGSITRISSKRGALGHVVVFRDISEMKKLTAVIDFQAHHDSLTNLPNRERLTPQLTELMDELKRNNGSHVLLQIDIDDFSNIKNEGGVLGMDDVLRQTADILRSHIQRKDLAARLGGDIFILILRDCDVENAQHVANKLRETIKERRFTFEEKVFSLTVSIGMVPLTGMEDGLRSIFLAAEAACLKAKKAGGDRVFLSRE